MKAGKEWISISDMMTGLMMVFLFIAVILIARVYKERARGVKERSILLDHFCLEINKQKLSVIKAECNKAAGVLRLIGPYFDSGRRALNQRGKNDLKEIEKILQARLICYSDLNSPAAEKKWLACRKGEDRQKWENSLKKWRDYCKKKFPDKHGLIETVLIEGHADSDPIGGNLKKQGIKTNFDLAIKRSQSVFQELLRYKEGTQNSQPSGNYLYFLINSQGMPLFGIASYGNLRRSNAQGCCGPAQKGKSKDRRVDIRLIMSPPKAAFPMPLSPPAKASCQNQEGS